MIPNRRFLDGMHEWHIEAFKTFDGGSVRFFSLEWHRRSRKTTFWLNLAVREACRNSKRTYLLIGPTKEQERQIVWDDPNMLDAALPDRDEMAWEKNEQKLQVRFANGSRIVIRGSDDPDSIRGVGPHGVGFDEWALIKPMTWQEIIRPIIAEDVTRWAMFMYTPKGLNHATELHDAAKGRPEWFASTLRASASGILSAAELAKAREDMPPVLYDQEMECARITDEEKVLITSRMLAGLSAYDPDIDPPEELAERRIIACDPAMGGDEAPMQYIVAGRIVDQEISHDRDSMKLAGALAIFGRKHHCEEFAIDTIGNGKGVVDRLAEMGKIVHAFNSAEAAQEPDRFANLRAEAWWNVMQLVMDRKVPALTDPVILKQLAATHWQTQTSSGRLILEPKARTKKALGCSPDRADCYVIGLWGLQFVAPDDEPAENYETASAGSWQAQW